MKPTYGQVCGSGQATTRDFYGLEAITYPKGLESKGRHIGSSGRIHPNKRNCISPDLLPTDVVYYNQLGKSAR